MGRQLRFWILVASLAILGSACSTENKSGQGQVEATKPPPQVRVELLPTSTPLPPPPMEEVAPTPTIEPTAAVVFSWPTPNVDEMADQVGALLNDMKQRLKGQNINIKP